MMPRANNTVPGISVVMPAYNAEKTLAAAVQSVLAQTYADFELLIVDDCSTDGTAALAEQLARRDSRIRILRNERNSGVSVSRNFGVAQAKYPWIALLDSDDQWTPEKLERQLRVLETQEDAGLIFTGVSYIDEAGRHSDFVFHVPRHVTFRELLRQNVISCSSVLVKRELLECWPMYPDQNIHEDYAAWLQILKEIPCAVGVDEPLLIYRVSSGSKSGNKLRSAGMQWRTYRYVGVGVVRSACCFAAYTLRGLRKHRAISGQMH